MYEIGTAAETTGDSSHVVGQRWSRTALLLSVVSGSLAAVSGVVGLAWDVRTLAAILALAAALVGAIVVALRPAEQAAQAYAFADACWEVSGAARDDLLAVADMTVDEARKTLDQLRRRSHEVSRRRPGPRADSDTP